MKKSLMLFLVFCGVIALLAAPGMVVADDFVFFSDPNGQGSYRDFSIFVNFMIPNQPYLFSLSNEVQLLDPPYISIPYTPGPNQPGYVDPRFFQDNNLPNQQHTYIINLPSPIGGQLQDIPGLSPITGYSGLLVLTHVWVPVLPQTQTEWLTALQDPKFLSNVAGIVAFVPGVSTAVVYENCQQVPEPGGLLLLGSGLIALGGIRRVIKK